MSMETNRAYSVLEIKAYDDQARTITGWATTPETDRMGDIVNPLGAKFAREMPLLWQHKHDSPVGSAYFGKATKKGIPFEASVISVEEDGPLKTLVDLAWQSVKYKLVRGVSIGFRALKYSFMESGGVMFDETEIYELSLVTIPANASATIQSIKAMDQMGTIRPSSLGVRLIKPAVEKNERRSNGGIKLLY
jgi:HK97 family phage prohead protease